MRADHKLASAATYDPIWTQVYTGYDPVCYEHLQAVFLRVWAPVEEAQRKLEQVDEPGD